MTRSIKNQIEIASSKYTPSMLPIVLKQLAVESRDKIRHLVVREIMVPVHRQTKCRIDYPVLAQLSGDDLGGILTTLSSIVWS